MSNEKLSEIVMKVWTDPAFKKTLLDDPKTVLESEGFSFPSGIREVKVVENSDEIAYLVIPATPVANSLSKEDLTSRLDEILGVQLVLPTVLAR